eukprot:gene3178-3250_t
MLTDGLQVVCLQETYHAEGDSFKWLTRRWGGTVVASEGIGGEDQGNVSNRLLTWARHGKLQLIEQGARYQLLKYKIAGREIWIANWYNIACPPTTMGDVGRLEATKQQDYGYAQEAVAKINVFAKRAEQEKRPLIVAADMNYNLRTLLRAATPGGDQPIYPMLLAQVCEGNTLQLAEFEGDPEQVATYSKDAGERGASNTLIDGFLVNQWGRPGAGRTRVGAKDEEYTHGHRPVAVEMDMGITCSFKEYRSQRRQGRLPSWDKLTEEEQERLVETEVGIAKDTLPPAAARQKRWEALAQLR